MRESGVAGLPLLIYPVSHSVTSAALLMSGQSQRPPGFQGEGTETLPLNQEGKDSGRAYRIRNVVAAIIIEQNLLHSPENIWVGVKAGITLCGQRGWR